MGVDIDPDLQLQLLLLLGEGYYLRLRLSCSSLARGQFRCLLVSLCRYSGNPDTRALALDAPAA